MLCYEIIGNILPALAVKQDLYSQDNKGKQPLWHGMKLALKESFDIETHSERTAERSSRTLSLLDINYIEKACIEYYDWKQHLAEYAARNPFLVSNQVKQFVA